MIPARRWRPVATGLVVMAGLLLVLLAAPASTGVVLAFVALGLAVLTGWALWRPGGWGSLALVVAQVWTVVGTRGVPEDLLGWLLAFALAVAVLGTHLSLAMLAAWPPGAGLPSSTARRWGRQTGVLVVLTALAAGVAVLAGRTPLGWEVPLGAVAVLLLAAATARLAVETRD